MSRRLSCSFPDLESSPDVGGGSVANEKRYSLARISLRWMVRECFKVKTGILFKSNRFHEIGLDPSKLYLEAGTKPPPLPVDPESHHWDAPKRSLIQRLLCLRESYTAPSGERVPFRSEEEEDLNDALSPIYDQLKLEWPWWILESFPWTFKHQHYHNKKWETKTHFG